MARLQSTQGHDEHIGEEDADGAAAQVADFDSDDSILSVHSGDSSDEEHVALGLGLDELGAELPKTLAQQVTQWLQEEYGYAEEGFEDGWS